MKKNSKYKKGFTLIELLTAVSIFVVVMIISMGSIMGVFDSNRKSRSLRAVMSNLNLVMESMSKEMKFGNNYHCGTGNPSNPQNCASGGDLLSFTNNDGLLVTYGFSSGAITKEVNGEGQAIALTAPEVVVDDLDFYVLGAGTDNSLHPKIVIRVKSHSGSGKGRTDLILQTLVSQRETDN